MDTDQVISQARAMIERVKSHGNAGTQFIHGPAARAQVCEFLGRYAGPRNSFTSEAEKVQGEAQYVCAGLIVILNSFIEFLEAGLLTGISPERKAQIDVVSDILGQAQAMLESSKIHPAAPALLVGASLEEFLRTWVEAEDLSTGNSKPGIDAYSKALLRADLIQKQDMKDITSWAGIRNHAAHGEWEEVGDRKRVRMMLDGVNWFMRQKMG